MGVVNFQLEASEAKAVGAFLKVVDAQRKTERGANKAAAASKRHEKAMKHVGSMVSSWLGVGAAIGAVTTGIRSVITEMKRLDVMNRTATLSVVGQISSAGDIAQASQIKKFLRTQFAGTGIGYQQAGELYGTLRGAAPSLSLDRILSLTRQAAGGRRAGMGMEAVKGFGTIMGGLAVAAPGKTAGDIADIASYIEMGQGRHGKKISRGGLAALAQWKAAELGDVETGVGMMMASIQAGQGTMPFQTLVDKLAEQRVLPALQRGRKITGAQRAERAFWTARPMDRLGMLRGDPALRGKILGTQVARVTAMFGGRPSELTSQVRRAQEEDAWRLRQLEALEANRRYARELAIEEKEAVEERQVAEPGPPSTEQQLRFLTAQEKAAGRGAISRGTRGALRRVGSFFPADIDLYNELGYAASRLSEAANDLKDTTETIPSINRHAE